MTGLALRSWSWHAEDRHHAQHAQHAVLEYIHDLALVNHEHAFSGILGTRCADCPQGHAALVIVGPARELPPIEEVPALSRFLENEWGMAPAHDLPDDIVHQLWARRKHSDGSPCTCYEEDSA
jgi:hypothetical protein